MSYYDKDGREYVEFETNRPGSESGEHVVCYKNECAHCLLAGKCPTIEGNKLYNKVITSVKTPYLEAVKGENKRYTTSLFDRFVSLLGNNGSEERGKKTKKENLTDEDSYDVK